MPWRQALSLRVRWLAATLAALAVALVLAGVFLHSLFQDHVLRQFQSTLTQQLDQLTARLEFDAGWTDMAQSLMAIRKTVTAGGRQYTYTAGRNDNTGHADLAWALFHALHNEPLVGQTTANTGRMFKVFCRMSWAKKYGN